MPVPDVQLAESVAQLVRIPSVNTLHAGPKAGVPGEAAVARAVAERLEECGAQQVVLDEIEPGRLNVYGLVAGHTDRLVVLDTHLDTVSVEHMTDEPFDGRIEHGCVWGRGALDTKASLGVMLAQLAEWHRQGLRPTPTLLVVGTIAEEGGGLQGARQFRIWAEGRGLHVDEMIVAEPTQLAPVHGHKAGWGMHVTVHGRSAHSALPHLGLNAIDAMADVLVALRHESERLGKQISQTALGNGTLNVATITGGSGGNVVPDRCRIQLGRRIVPGEDSTAEFRRVEALVREACPLPVEVESVIAPEPDGSIGMPAFYQPPDGALATKLARWAGTHPAVAPYGTNALRYLGLAKEIVVFGPGSIDDAHQATECVRIDDLVRLAAMYERWLEPTK